MIDCNWLGEKITKRNCRERRKEGFPECHNCSAYRIVKVPKLEPFLGRPRPSLERAPRVHINTESKIYINPEAMRLLPKGTRFVELMWSPGKAGVFGISPVEAGTRDAYPIHPTTKRGQGRQLGAKALMKEIGLFGLATVLKVPPVMVAGVLIVEARDDLLDLEAKNHPADMRAPSYQD